MIQYLLQLRDDLALKYTVHNLIKLILFSVCKGMNSAIRAVARLAIYAGAKAYAVYWVSMLYLVLLAIAWC